MSKAKFYFSIAAAYLCALFFAAPAFAWTHGQFSATTDACAGCHVAHAAQAPKLLKTGPTQTQFCYLCHGDGAASAPYDIKDGKTSDGTNTYPSTAGGFERWWDGSQYKTVTSRHNIWGLVGESGSVIDETYKVYQIPGGTGTNQIGGSGFVCGSCHDPHDGGKVPDGSGYITGSSTSANPRLLRRSITVIDSAYTDLYVSLKMSTVGTFTYQGVSSGVYRVIEYKSGSTRWCGACHNRFKTSNRDSSLGSGHANYYFGMWRHPMDGHVVPPPGFDGSIDTGTPLEKPGSVYHVSCFTCHRAHGSPAAKTGWASSWPRDVDLGGTSTTSALLRMDNRGTCYNCHGAGQYNCWNDSRLHCSSCHPGTYHGSSPDDCTTCHVF